jgi:hypothetical protein
MAIGHGPSLVRHSRGNGHSARRTSSGSETQLLLMGRSWLSASRISPKRRLCSLRIPMPTSRFRTSTDTRLSSSNWGEPPRTRFERRSSTAGWHVHRRTSRTDSARDRRLFRRLRLHRTTRRRGPRPSRGCGTSTTTSTMAPSRSGGRWSGSDVTRFADSRARRRWLRMMPYGRRPGPPGRCSDAKGPEAFSQPPPWVFVACLLSVADHVAHVGLVPRRSGGPTGRRLQVLSTSTSTRPRRCRTVQVASRAEGQAS